MNCKQTYLSADRHQAAVIFNPNFQNSTAVKEPINPCPA